MKQYKPMLLSPVKTVEALPQGKDWVYERKYNGWRFLAYYDDELDESRLISRGGNDYTDDKRFASVASQIGAAANYLSAVFDGELVRDFQGEQDLRTFHIRQAKLTYYVFDLLDIDGIPLVGMRWSARQAALDEIFQSQPNIKRARAYKDKNRIVKKARDLGHEGVVAKNVRGVYTQDQRTVMAVKYKIPRNKEPD
jgi:bifunctional non-homologous end joining protein LigD